MSTTHGKSGSVKISTNAVAEVTAFKLDHSAKVADDTVMGDASESHQIGILAWSGSCDCFWDASDTTGQEAMDAGASVEIHLLPQGAGAGNIDYNGTCTIVSVSRAVTKDGVNTASFSFTGNGALTQSTLA